MWIVKKCMAQYKSSFSYVFTFLLMDECKSEDITKAKGKFVLFFNLTIKLNNVPIETMTALTISYRYLKLFCALIETEDNKISDFESPLNRIEL